MFKELIDAIQDGVKPNIIKVGEKEYSSRPLHNVPLSPIAQSLKTITLASIVAYFFEDIDKHGKVDIFVHVEGHDQVSIVKYLNDERRRETLLTATYEGHNFRFGTKYTQDVFITALQSMFVDTEQRRELQSFVGSLSSESSLKLEDDGLSQKTVARRGVTTVERVENGNVYKLKPFRTFSEVDQPESDFILRLHREDGSTPTISLHESDNFGWKVTAIKNIQSLLEEDLPTGISIIA